MEGLAGRLGALVAVVAFVGAVGWLNVGAWSEWSAQRRLTEEGVRAVAEVVATEESDVPRSDGQSVTVRFDVSGEPVSVDVEVDEATLDRAIRSGTLDVVHAVDDPSLVAVASDGRVGMIVVVAGVVDLTLIGGLAVVVINDRRQRSPDVRSG